LALQRPKLTPRHRPTINDHYGTTFNPVDRFNRLVGAVSYQPRNASEHSRVITGVISFAIVEAWVLVCDWREGTNDLEDKTLRQEARKLYSALIGNE